MKAKAPARLLGILGLAWLTVVAGAAASLLNQRATAGREIRALGAVEVERDRLAALSPAPTEANLAALREDLATSVAEIERLRSVLGLAKSPASDPPAATGSAAVFFELMEFADRLGARARRAGVAIRPGERFGFAGYAQRGPTAELQRAVLGQKAALEPVLDRLIEARPAALLAVQRERPKPIDSADAEARPESHADISAESGADLIEPGGPDTGRQPGVSAGGVFRVSFAGETGALREFLNALVSSPLPVIVAGVEAEPWAPTPAHGANGAWTRGILATSKFTVTWETVVPVDSEATADAP